MQTNTAIKCKQERRVELQESKPHCVDTSRHHPHNCATTNSVDCLPELGSKSVLATTANRRGISRYGMVLSTTVSGDFPQGRASKVGLPGVPASTNANKRKQTQTNAHNTTKHHNNKTAIERNKSLKVRRGGYMSSHSSEAKRFDKSSLKYYRKPAVARQ